MVLRLYKHRIIKLCSVFIILILFSIPISYILLENKSETNWKNDEINYEFNMPFFSDNNKFKHNLNTRSGSNEDLILSGKNQMTITEPTECGNLSIHDNATLTVENSEFEIKGFVRMSENSQFNIINSIVTISPPALPDDIIVASFSDKASILIKDSTFITHSQPSITNVTYLITDDNTNVTIKNSELTAYLPAVVHQSVYLTPATAGTYVLTGETTWTISDSNLNGYLSINETDYLTGRWYWFTQQRKTNFKIYNSICTLNEETQPFFKPISGNFLIENCEITAGMIDAEVIADLEINNLTISYLNVRDQSRACIKNSYIINDIDIGSVAVISPTEGSVSDVQTEAYLNIENSKIGNLIISGNSTMQILDSEVSESYLNHNSTAIIKDTSLSKIIAYDQSTLHLENSTAPNIFCEKNSIINIKNATEKIDWVRTGYNYQSSFTILNTEIEKFEIWPGDNIAPININPVQYEVGYNGDLNVSAINMNLIDSAINDLQTYDDNIISIELTNSEINDITIREFKYENIFITFIDTNSVYPIPELPVNEVSTISIQYKFEVEVLLNNLPIKAAIEIFDENNEPIIQETTDDNGHAESNLDSKIIDNTGTNTYMNYFYRISYFGFSQDYNLVLTTSQVQYINFSDTTPPKISDLKFGPTTWNFEKDVKIKVNVKDDDIQLISNVTLFYSTNDGKTWRSTDMNEVSEDNFEAIISKSQWGSNVEFYITTYDILGNKAETKVESYSVAEEEVNSIVLIIIIVIILILIYLIKVSIHKRKINKYKTRKTSELIKEAK